MDHPFTQAAHNHDMTSRRSWLRLLAAGAAVRDSARAAKDVLPQATFDVRHYGARGDGATVNTRSIQSAIDACTSSGGGSVLVAGGRYVTGTIYLKSNVCLRIEAGSVLLGSRHIADYATDTDRNMYLREPHMDRCLIFARSAENISIEGHGVIDGQGAAFPEKGDAAQHRPKLIRLLGCSRIRVRDIKLQAPASWTTEWRYCSDIVVDGATIFARARFNGDGLDFDGCTNVRVSNCNFDTSDDSICLQTSATDKPCSDVLIMNCHFSSHWAGIRIGLLSRGNFENVLVSNCSFRDHNDSGVKIQMCEGGEMKNMIFSNLIMKNVPRPVFLTLCQQRAWVDSPPEYAPMKSVSDIRFSNIIVDTQTGGTGAAFIVTGMPGHPVANISFSDISATFPGGGTEQDSRTVLQELTTENLNGHWPEYESLRGTVPAHGLYARHVDGIHLRNVEFSTRVPDARPPVVAVDVTGIRVADTLAAIDKREK
jgi:polygalacturonase